MDLKIKHLCLHLGRLLVLCWITRGVFGQTCPRSCTRCEVNALGDVENVTCSDANDFKLVPKTVKNLVFENGQVPVGTLKDFYFLGIDKGPLKLDFSR
jgi:hypothetical protein